MSSRGLVIVIVLLIQFFMLYSQRIIAVNLIGFSAEGQAERIVTGKRLSRAWEQRRVRAYRGGCRW